MSKAMIDSTEGGWIDYEIGETYFKLRQFDKALEYYDKALDTGIVDAWIHYKKGFALIIDGRASEGMNELNRAIEESKSALSAINQNPMLLFNLGLFHLAKEDVAEAGNYYAKALNVKASRSKIWEAIRDLEGFLEVRPEQLGSQNILNTLKEKLSHAEA